MSNVPARQERASVHCSWDQLLKNGGNTLVSGYPHVHARISVYMYITLYI